MKKTVVLIASVVIFLGIYFIVSSKNHVANVVHYNRVMHNSIFDFDEEIYSTYFYLIDPKYYENNSNLQPNQSDYIHYCTMASAAIAGFCESHYNHNNENVNKSLEILGNLRSTFEHYGYFPRPEFNSVHTLKYGWASSMDAPVVALASQMAYEITGDEQWHKFRDELIEYCKKTTAEHGFLLEESDGTFYPLGFAEKDTTPENAFYVYNCSLFGYQALEMLASICKDDELVSVLDKIIYNYENKASKYRYRSEEWLWYMLNPKVVHRTEKIIIELNALRSLSKILPDCNFFTKELGVREMVLGNLYKTYMVGNKGYFWRAAGPQPYMIDMMPTLLEIMDANGNVLDRYYMQGETFDDSWMLFYISDNAKSVNVYAAPLKPNSDEYLYKTLLCKSDVEEVNPDSMYDILPYSSARQGNSIILKLSNKINFKEHFCRFALEIENDTNNEYNTRLIYNDGMHRYYTPIKPGKNLILINTLGIREADSNETKYIDSIELRLFGKDKDVDINNIAIKNVLLFHNAYEVYRYQKSSEYVVNFQ